jgi:hypothetical protein
MCPAEGELKMQAQAGPAQHDSVEAFVVDEASDPLQPEATHIHHGRPVKVPDRPGDANVAKQDRFPAVSCWAKLLQLRASTE